jgi:hypothetical protein
MGWALCCCDDCCEACISCGISCPTLLASSLFNFGLAAKMCTSSGLNPT